MSTNALHLSWFQQTALKVLGIAENFWAVLEPALASDFQQLVAQVVPLAVPVVTSFLTDGTKTGSQKAAAALDQIKPLAAAAGINASNQAINIAIELALAAVQPKTVSPFVLPQTAPNAIPVH